ncbi:MAG: helix-turn-helix domain-containing protein [Victivallaceae bacterium]
MAQVQDKLPVNYREIVYRGVESDELDYKSALNWNKLTRAGKSKIIRHCLALANTKGGYLVIGVGEDESGHPSVYFGLNGEEAHSFDPSNVGPFINRHVEPPLDFTIERPTIDGKRYAIFVVRPFATLPHVCANGVEGELLQGVFYIRTSDAASRPAIRAIEMHALIQRALRNQRELLGRMLRGILYENRDANDRSSSHFDDELSNIRHYFNHRRPGRGDFVRCEFAVIPGIYDAERFGFNALRRAAEVSRTLRPGVAFFDTSEVSEAYITNTALRVFPEKQQRLFQIGKNGLFAYFEQLPATDRELSLDYLVRLFASLIDFVGKLYTELGFYEETLDLVLTLDHTSDLKLLADAPPPTRRAAETAMPPTAGVCRIDEIRIKMRRSAADLASGREAHAARLIREIGERFNLPEECYRNLPRVIRTYLDKR